MNEFSATDKGNEGRTETHKEKLSNEEVSATNEGSAENSIKSNYNEVSKFEDKDKEQNIQNSEMKTEGGLENNVKNKDVEDGMTEVDGICDNQEGLGCEYTSQPTASETNRPDLLSGGGYGSKEHKVDFKDNRSVDPEKYTFSLTGRKPISLEEKRKLGEGYIPLLQTSIPEKIGLKVVDFRQPEVLLVNKVHQFEGRKRPLEALADMGLNGEYNLKDLMTLVSLGAARTRSDPKLRPTTRHIVSILGAKLWTFIDNAGGFSQIEEKG
ncbi:hypothetical protein JHK86_012570 [Glycine max]|nr:hypothetical protein JHK86_012570 [Glycine max]